MKIISYFPVVYTGQGPSYTAVSIAASMATKTADISFWTPWARAPFPSGLDGRATSRLKLPYRAIAGTALLDISRQLLERQIIREIEKSAVPTALHLWPGASLGFLRKAKQAGALIFREMINSHEGFAKAIVDQESSKLGLTPQHSISDASAQREIAFLAECDFILSPSEFVDESLLAFDVEASRIRQVSFGWDPAKFGRSAHQGETPPRREIDGLHALFVGSIGVRKGIHLALEAWEKANVPGLFTLVGRIEPDFAPIINRYLKPGRVEHHSFSPNPASFFQSADFFLFPTLEEGAPLVCYESSGSGLPLVTSKAGQARMIEDGLHGFVVDPHDIDALVSSIHRMRDPAKRSSMQAHAVARANEFTWDHAAMQRIETFSRELVACP